MIVSNRTDVGGHGSGAVRTSRRRWL